MSLTTSLIYLYKYIPCPRTCLKAQGKAHNSLATSVPDTVRVSCGKTCRPTLETTDRS